MHAVIEALNGMPLAGLMLVVALGYSVGRLSWRGLGLGPAGGTLLVALLLGRAGLSFAALYGQDAPVLTLGAFGFCLFIYSVGFEAGPRFFSSLLGGPGWRFVLVGTVVNVAAVALAVACAGIFGLGAAATAGLLSGALTSAPTYAAAVEAAQDTTSLAVAFVLTYPVGLVGVVLLVQFVPRLCRQDLDEDLDEDGAEGPAGSPELTRAFEVRCEEAVGATLADLALPRRTGCHVTMLHRAGEMLVPTASTRLEAGDHLLVRGRLEGLEALREVVGPEIYDEDLRSRMPSPRGVVVTQPGAVGRTLRDLDLAGRFGVLVTSIRRGEVRLDAGADVALGRGDVAQVVGRRGDVRRAAAVLGRPERPTHETDIAVYAGGIFLGLLIARLPLPAAGGVRLGASVGLLLSGVALGRLRHLPAFHTDVPRAARQLVRDLGILLFVAETGVKAGGTPTDALHHAILPILAASALVTVLSVGLAMAFARRVLGMRPVDAWGSVCGGMTSTAALTALRRATDGSNAPALSYAASYAVASVLVTVAGRVVVYLVS